MSFCVSMHEMEGEQSIILQAFWLLCIIPQIQLCGTLRTVITMLSYGRGLWINKSGPS